MQPDDYVALDETMIDESMLAEAHTLAGEFVRDAVLYRGGAALPR